MSCKEVLPFTAKFSYIHTYILYVCVCVYLYIYIYLSSYSYFHMKFIHFSFPLCWTRTQRKGSIKRIDRCFSSWQCDFVCWLERLLLLGCDYTASCCCCLLLFHFLLFLCCCCCCRLFCCCCRCRWLSLSFAFQNKNSKSPEGGPQRTRHTPALARLIALSFTLALILSLCVCVCGMFVHQRAYNK